MQDLAYITFVFVGLFGGMAVLSCLGRFYGRCRTGRSCLEENKVLPNISSIVEVEASRSSVRRPGFERPQRSARRSDTQIGELAFEDSHEEGIELSTFNRRRDDQPISLSDSRYPYIRGQEVESPQSHFPRPSLSRTRGPPQHHLSDTNADAALTRVRSPSPVHLRHPPPAYSWHRRNGVAVSHGPEQPAMGLHGQNLDANGGALQQPASDSLYTPLQPIGRAVPRRNRAVLPATLGLTRLPPYTEEQDAENPLPLYESEEGYATRMSHDLELRRLNTDRHHPRIRAQVEHSSAQSSERDRPRVRDSVQNAFDDPQNWEEWLEWTQLRARQMDREEASTSRRPNGAEGQQPNRRVWWRDYPAVTAWRTIVGPFSS